MSKLIGMNRLHGSEGCDRIGLSEGCFLTEIPSRLSFRGLRMRVRALTLMGSCLFGLNARRGN